MSAFSPSMWSDVVPIPQDDGPAPMVSIAYSADYRRQMDLFRAVIASGEHSDRVLDLTRSILRMNPANYTVWQYRRTCLFNLNKNLTDELNFMDTFSDENPKNYQIWHHRRVIAEKQRDGGRELEFTRKVFGVDGKNYHAWAHRQWALKAFDLWGGELEFIDEAIKTDIRNNSAWNQRWFVVQKGPIAFTRDLYFREVEYCFDHISKAPDNESVWNYLRGLLFHTCRDIVGDVEIEIMMTRLKRMCEEADVFNQNNRHLFSLTADLCEKTGFLDNYLLADTLFTKLGEMDCVRKKYWLSRGERLRELISLQATPASAPAALG